MPSAIALIIGGAENVLAEFAQAHALCFDAGRGYATFVTNDMIAHFPGRADFAVTHHPKKFKTWLEQRALHGFAAPGEAWANARHEGLPANIITSWNGSVGLLAVQVARAKGFEAIILCGVPMRATAGHFLRRQRWAAASYFQRPWEARKAELSPYVRSWSGFTAEAFGLPTRAWIDSVPF